MHVLLTGATGHAGSAIQKKLVESDQKVTALVRGDADAVCYGHGRGPVPNRIASSPRTAEDEWILVGDGSQHLATVHADDLADLVVLALERGSGYYITASDDHPTIRELTEAASRGAGGSGAVTPESRADTEARFGPALAAALLLDQQTSSAKARNELGWRPSAEGLVDELAQGMHATAAA